MNVGALLERAQGRFVTIAETARLTEAADRLGDEHARLLVVCDRAGRMAGVVGRTDIVARISRCTGCTCSEAVSAAMTTDVQFCRPGEALDEVWARMRSEGYFHLPVVDEDRRPLGVRPYGPRRARGDDGRHQQRRGADARVRARDGLSLTPDLGTRPARSLPRRIQAAGEVRPEPWPFTPHLQEISGTRTPAPGQDRRSSQDQRPQGAGRT